MNLNSFGQAPGVVPSLKLKPRGKATPVGTPSEAQEQGKQVGTRRSVNTAGNMAQQSRPLRPSTICPRPNQPITDVLEGAMNMPAPVEGSLLPRFNTLEEGQV